MKKEDTERAPQSRSELSTVEAKLHGSKDSAILDAALVILEKMTRDCFVIVRETWRSDHSIVQIQELVGDKITACLAQLVGRLANENTNIKHPTRVFVATNFRGLRGGLRTPSVERTALITTDETLSVDYSEFMTAYGRLGEHGRIVSPDARGNAASHLFMPVAFWNDAMYEQPLRWSQNHSELISLGGFSKWTADYGMMFVSADDNKLPLYGFHFSRADQKVPFKCDIASGLVHIKFAKNTKPQAVNKTFNQAMRMLHDKHGVLFSKGRLSKPLVDWLETPLLQVSGQNDDSMRNAKGFHPLPVITPADQREKFQELAEWVFSTFFYSNFADPAEEGGLWKKEFTEFIQTLRRQKEERAAQAAEDLLTRYCLNSESAGETNILTFEHYYAFLLNPGLSFNADLGKEKDAALGTVNFYSNVEIPLHIVASIRQHLESVCHLIRDIEEWEEGKMAMLRDVSITMGHEINKVYNGAAVALDRALETTELTALAPREIFAFNVARGAMCYGMLWAHSSSNNLLPSAANLGNYAIGLMDMAWQLWLAGYVVGEGGGYRATDVEIGTLNRLWVTSASKQLLDITVNPDEKSRVWPILKECKDAISQWYLAAMVNAIKHLLPLDTKKLSERIQLITKWLEAQKTPVVEFKVVLYDNVVTLAVLNEYRGKIDHTPDRAHSTGLALDMAALALQRQLDKRRRDLKLVSARFPPQVVFEGKAAEHTWEARLTFEVINDQVIKGTDR